MKQLLAIIAIIILALSVGGVIVGFAAQADSMGSEVGTVTTGILSEEGPWAGAGVPSAPEGPGGTEFPGFGVDYTEFEATRTYELGAYVTGVLYSNGDLVVTGSGSTYDVDPYVPDGRIIENEDGVERIWISGEVSRLGDLIFSYLPSVTDVLISDSVISIGDKCFEEAGISEITIPRVSEMGDFCFSNCDNLASVIFEEGCTVVGSNCFCGCPNLFSVELPNTMATIEDSAFVRTGITTLSIPASVTSLGCRIASDLYDSAYNHLETVIFEDGFDLSGNEGEYAFHGLTSLTSVVLPDSLTMVPAYMFYESTALTSADLPPNLETIGGSAFVRTAITSVTIPASVDSFGSSCFSGCSSLANAYFLGNAPTYMGQFPGSTIIHILPGATGFEEDTAWADCYTLVVD